MNDNIFLKEGEKLNMYVPKDTFGLLYFLIALHRQYAFTALAVIVCASYYMGVHMSLVYPFGMVAIIVALYAIFRFDNLRFILR